MNISSVKSIIILSTLLFISIPCLSQNSDPVSNYNYFVDFLDQHYGLFPYKGVRWDSLTTHYSRFISNETSADTLFFTLSRLASHLRDKHLWIDNDKYAFNYSIGNVVFTKQLDSIYTSRQVYKNPDLIKSKYLKDEFYSYNTNNFLVGKINSDIGYISLDYFNGNQHKTDSLMTNIFNYLDSCNYLIIDIRNNFGGTDSSALFFANHLIKTDHCYQIARIRSGNDDDAYADPVYWKTTAKDVSFNRKIIVLINRYSISAAETFSLAIKDQPHIKFLGEPTAGAFSDSEDGYLPNGWHFSYSIGVWTDCNGILWEEKGVQPDIKLSNLQINNVDNYIEQAIKIFREELF